MKATDQNIEKCIEWIDDEYGILTANDAILPLPKEAQDVIDVLESLKLHRQRLLPFADMLKEITSCSKDLREAQAAYLNDRTNELKGMMVGQCAARLDECIKKSEEVIQNFNMEKEWK